MDNLSIFIFSIIVAVSFSAFVFLTFKGYGELDEKPYQGKKKPESEED
jgi:hypothetical protein